MKKINKNRELRDQFKPGEIFEKAGFDDKTLTIKNSVLVGSLSENGYSFTEQALQDLARLLEGAKCYINHDMTKDSLEARDFKELYAKVSNTRYDSDTRKVMGDISLAPTRENIDNVFPALKHFAEDVGNSINAMGVSEFVDEGEIVTEVFHLESLDMVTKPATTKNIFESSGSKKITEEVEPMDLKELKSKHPDLYEKVIAEGKTIALQESEKDGQVKVLTEQVESLKATNADLATKLDDAEVKLKAKDNDEAIAKLLKESKLPEDAITETFKTNLKRCETDEERNALIDDRKALLEGSGGGVMNPGKGVGDEDGDNSNVISLDEVAGSL